MRVRRRDLLTHIERGAHDSGSDLPSLLRRCISLGGVTGSESLRDWASRELMGYRNDDEIPDYRTGAAPLVQVLFAFLLTVPFTSRFDALDATSTQVTPSLGVPPDCTTT